ncbi:MAG: T9SS type A sorting domain-containing protein [Saprospiraceae bacterium]|nr:T9SS type A sorting domain-containing protein [Saprospiraceae bacterium]MDW8230599.1 T9SS type A sorting domain-containing protein [Saprospiraceae bacterium]
MKSLLTLLLMCTLSATASGQKTRSFSPFDGTLAGAPGSSLIRTSKGYLLYVEAPEVQGLRLSPDTIRCLSEEGDLLRNIPLPSAYRHSGSLFESNSRYFFTALRYGTDSSGAKVQERVYYEFNADGQIIRTVAWPNVAPANASVFFWMVGDGFQKCRYVSATLKGDTLYTIFDYYVWPPSAPGGGVRLQYEKLGLNGSVYRVVDISPFTKWYAHAEFTEDQIFLFGSNTGPNYPGTTGSGYGSVGRYDWNGNFLGVLSIDDPRFRQFVAGSCNYVNQRFYCNFYNYFGDPFTNINPYPSSGCSLGENVILDIRSKDFIPVKGINLPECGHPWSVLGRAFAVSPNGDIYYATYKEAQTVKLVLYKFNSDLQVKWQIAIPSAVYTAFVEPANDGGALLGAYSLEAANYRFRLLRISPDGQVSEKGAFPLGGPLSVFPNPATDYLYIADLPDEAMRYELVNAQGQISATGPLVGNRLDLTAQPAGIYVLRLLDDRTGRPIAVQKVMKQ